MLRLLALTIVTIALIGCISGGEAAETEILGAGATFPYPLYSKMFDAYYKEYGIRINYQAIGSGGGIKQLQNKTVDFGGTDAFMSDEELKAMDGAVLHIPTCLGAVAITYNLPGNPVLNMTSDILADIFLGKITAWDDSRLKAVNPDAALPDMAIVVVHRSDGSGTTFIFSDYLSKVSEDWNAGVGTGKSLNWPTGLGAKGNPGVAGLVKQLPGSIGYVELVYALQNGMAVGLIRNKAGNYIRPTIESVTLAAEIDLPADTRVSLTDTGAEEGYPIGGFTWLILYQEQEYDGRPRVKAEELVRLIWWMIHDGQEFAEPLHYAPLPESAVRKAEAVLASVVYGGEGLVQRLDLRPDEEN
jgi:phosphate transport system substrate-binding protein